MSEPAGKPASPGGRAWMRFKRNRGALISAWYLSVLLVAVIGWPALLKIAPADFARLHDPDLVTNAQFITPDTRHWFGTDIHGRDLFSRVLYGAQISLMVGAFGTLVSLVIGVLWGAIAGYTGGRTDSVMMRIVDVLYSQPSIIFVIVLVTTVGGLIKRVHFVEQSAVFGGVVRIALLIVTLGAISWLSMARIVRGQVLTLRTRQFVEASRALGAGPRWILARHIIPSTLGIVITYLALTIPGIILYESFLSYLGLGVEPPMASWGSLIAEGVGQINPVRIYWWLIIFPSAILAVTLLALNLVGDGLRDAWDVERRL
ncbi:MAG: ABC transporter permease [Limisphaerales bacterium]